MALGITSRHIRYQTIIVAIGTALLIAKFVAWYLTNSNAILTDALESIVNVVAGGVALYSLILAAKPKDINHPYGHGKVEFLSAGLEGSLIMLAGGAIIVKSIYNFFYPQNIQQLDIGMILIAVAGFVNYLMGYFIEHKGDRAGSVTMVASGKHLKSDAYSTVGLIVGLGVIYLTELFWLDNIVAIIFGSIIAYTGYGIVRKSVAGIMDEADYELLRELLSILNTNRRDNWIDIHNLRVIKYGSTLHVDCHITLPWYLNLKEAHHEIDMIDKLINENVGPQVEFFIHMDPCIPKSCTICQKMECEVRQHAMEKKVEWTLEQVLQNKKHSIY